MSNAWYRDHRRELMAKRGGCCEVCGRGTPNVSRGRRRLEFAHVAPTPLSGRSRGLNHRVLDVIRYPHHYALLCNLCHTACDNAGSRRIRSLAREAAARWKPAPHLTGEDG